jgi:hypothetical protein
MASIRARAREALLHRRRRGRPLGGSRPRPRALHRAARDQGAEWEHHIQYVSTDLVNIDEALEYELVEIRELTADEIVTKHRRCHTEDERGVIPLGRGRDRRPLLFGVVIMPKKKTPWKDRPLRVIVSRGVLSIEIGIDTLACSALNAPFAWDLVGRENHDVKPDSVFRIDDARQFARDVECELLAEAEDGSSLLSGLFDKASQKAIEEGSIAFIDTREEQ